MTDRAVIVGAGTRRDDHNLPPGGTYGFCTSNAPWRRAVTAPVFPLIREIGAGGSTRRPRFSENYLVLTTTVLATLSCRACCRGLSHSGHSTSTSTKIPSREVSSVTMIPSRLLNA